MAPVAGTVIAAITSTVRATVGDAVASTAPTTRIIIDDAIFGACASYVRGNDPRASRGQCRDGYTCAATGRGGNWRSSADT
ncbi:hypothetical protein H4582DRAFT_1985537 [Lactarius indigo]|nr:hypothetical protein H4582DRAFT_1985537 [Lactarius indigo]